MAINNLGKDIDTLVGETSTKKYTPKDFGNIRRYPSEHRMEGPKWIGNHYALDEALGGADKFKFVGDEDGHSIFQGPDGYYSGNPRINTVSFKTVDDLKKHLKETPVNKGMSDADYYAELEKKSDPQQDPLRKSLHGAIAAKEGEDYDPMEADTRVADEMQDRDIKAITAFTKFGKHNDHERLLDDLTNVFGGSQQQAINWLLDNVLKNMK